jgi:hypothetical protein
MDVATLQVTEFEMYAGGPPLDIAGVRRMLLSGTIVGFNSINYDASIIGLALAGGTNAQLKQANDAIIKGGVKPWMFKDRFGVEPAAFDHIDLIEILPGMYNLKLYGGKMASRRMQDLPIDPDDDITPEQRPLMRSYCVNDLMTTRDAYLKFKPQIELRVEMSKRYGVDLRSKSDAQIAEAVIKSELKFFIAKPIIPPGTAYRYKTPDFISFHTPYLQGVLAMI